MPCAITPGARLWPWAALAALLVTRSAAAAACARPTDAGGSDGYEYGAATVKSFGDSQVLVWYATDGEHAVNGESSRADGVPDDVATALAATSEALSSYASLGYRAPLSDATAPECGSNGGDGRLDVYLVSMRGADGMTVPEAGRCLAGAVKRCPSYLFAKANFAGVYETSQIGIRTVLPHETFHAVQNAYDAALDRFWAEGTAQWAAKTLDPSLGDLERNLPAFFGQASRSLDAPANGATAAFLYGSAIWPVFLSQRYGDDIVRSILEQEALAGGPAIAATDTVLRTLESSIQVEYPLFSAWNSATGSRTGTGGYLNAAHYPLVSVAELPSSGASGITSGLASFFFHAQVDSPMWLSLATDTTRNTATLVPFEHGLARVDQATPLPAELQGAGIVVVSGISTSKTDARFTLSLTNGAATAKSGGCSLSRQPAQQAPWLALLGLLGFARRRKLNGSRPRAWATRRCPFRAVRCGK